MDDNVVVVAFADQSKAYQALSQLRQADASGRLEVRATGVQLTDALKKDLEAVIAKHGGKLEVFGHPTTTLEDLFLREYQGAN